MTFEELLRKWPTSYAFEKATGLSHVNYVHWKKRGYIPIKSQMNIERITNGEFVANIAHDLSFFKEKGKTDERKSKRKDDGNGEGV